MRPSFSGESTTGGCVNVVAVAGASAFSARKMARRRRVGFGQGHRFFGQETDVEVAGGPFQAVEGLRGPLCPEAESRRLAAAEWRRGGALGGGGSQVRVGVAGDRADSVPQVAASGDSASGGRGRASRWSAAGLGRLQPSRLVGVGRRTVSGADDGVWYVGQSQDGAYDGVGSGRKLTISH